MRERKIGKRGLMAAGISVAVAGVGIGVHGPKGWEARAATVDPPRNPASMSPAGRVLADAAALVEGKVLTVSFSYDEESGPRTNFEFQVDRVHEGSVPTERLTLSVLSGFLPSGQFMTATDTPAFSEGQRCLLLLTAKSAFWSSIVPGYAFTIETFDGNDVVIGEEGDRKSVV